MLNAIRYVTSGLTLTAFLATVVLSIYRRRMQSREKLIELAPGDKRASLVESTLEVFSIDTARLTREQAYTLAVEQIRARAKRYQINAIVLLIIFVISAVVFALSFGTWGKTATTAQAAQIAPLVQPAPTEQTCDPIPGLSTWQDPSTGLTWTKQDSGCNLKWKAANDYCIKLNLANHNDWRLPTIQELRAIRDPKSSVLGPWMGENGHMVPFHVKGNLQLTGWTWSSSPTGGYEGIWHTSFASGSDAGNDSDGPTDINNWFDSRALCVRSGA